MSDLIKAETKFTVYAPDGSDVVLGVYDDEATALAAANAVQVYSDMLAARMQRMASNGEDDAASENEYR